MTTQSITRQHSTQSTSNEFERWLSALVFLRAANVNIWNFLRHMVSQLGAAGERLQFDCKTEGNAAEAK